MDVWKDFWEGGKSLEKKQQQQQRRLHQSWGELGRRSCREKVRATKKPRILVKAKKEDINLHLLNAAKSGARDFCANKHLSDITGKTITGEEGHRSLLESLALSKKTQREYFFADARSVRNGFRNFLSRINVAVPQKRGWTKTDEDGRKTRMHFFRSALDFIS